MKSGVEWLVWFLSNSHFLAVINSAYRVRHTELQSSLTICYPGKGKNKMLTIQTRIHNKDRQQQYILHCSLTHCMLNLCSKHIWAGEAQIKGYLLHSFHRNVVCRTISSATPLSLCQMMRNVGQQKCAAVKTLLKP